MNREAFSYLFLATILFLKIGFRLIGWRGEAKARKHEPSTPSRLPMRPGATRGNQCPKDLHGYL
jgi:hypothetical protein